MRKTTIGMLLLVAVVAFSAFAWAGPPSNQITLGPGSQQITFFTKTGQAAGTVSVDFGASCGTNQYCLTGPKAGTVPDNPYYMFEQTGAITLTYLGSGDWSVSQDNPLSFCVGGGCAGGPGGSILMQGSVELVNFSQATGGLIIGPVNANGGTRQISATDGSSTGEFNSGLGVNLVITNCSICSGSSGNAVLNLTVAFANGENIASLLDTHGSIRGNLQKAAITGFAPTPEPLSLLLFGSGLALVGSVIRRRTGTNS